MGHRMFDPLTSAIITAIIAIATLGPNVRGNPTRYGAEPNNAPCEQFFYTLHVGVGVASPPSALG
jgi:hypothetical protein